MPSIISVTPDSLEDDIYSANNFVLLDLWAPWCAPCRSLAPILEKLAALGGHKLTIAKMDVERYADARSHFNVRGIPALLLFKDGKEISREMGTKTLTQLKDWLNKSGVELSEPQPQLASTTTYGAFYGDQQLQQFFTNRLLEHAKRGQVQLGSDSFWMETTGTPSAAWVHSSDPEVFERLTGLAASFSVAFDFVSASKYSDLEPLLSAIKTGSDLSYVPLRLLQVLLEECALNENGVLSHSPEVVELVRKWISLGDVRLTGIPVSLQQHEELAARAVELRKHPDCAVGTAGAMIAALSPAPAADKTDLWRDIFALANSLVFATGQHLSGWTLEDRQTEERRHKWFTQKQAETLNSEFTDEELDAWRNQWMRENEAYQLKEDQFFSDNLKALRPVQLRLQEHLAHLLQSAPVFVAI